MYLCIITCYSTINTLIMLFAQKCTCSLQWCHSELPLIFSHSSGKKIFILYVEKKTVKHSGSFFFYSSQCYELKRIKNLIFTEIELLDNNDQELSMPAHQLAVMIVSVLQTQSTCRSHCPWVLGPGPSKGATFLRCRTGSRPDQVWLAACVSSDGRHTRCDVLTPPWQTPNRDWGTLEWTITHTIPAAVAICILFKDSNGNHVLWTVHFVLRFWISNTVIYTWFAYSVILKPSYNPQNQLQSKFNLKLCHLGWCAASLHQSTHNTTHTNQAIL